MKLGKKRRFLEANPACCFCGGEAPSVTTDHVPNRACFHGRQFPDGFEFPACGSCQAKNRKDEQAFAMMCHLSDRNSTNYDQRQSHKLLEGIKNNQPYLLPRVELSANDKRRGLRWLGQSLPHQMALRDVPMVELSRDFDPIIKRVAAKIGLALYYRHIGRAASREHAITCFWSQAANLRQMQGFVQVASELPFLETGWRPNIDFGDRFSYLWNRSLDANEPDVFATIAQFGQGLVICALIADGQCLEANERAEWVSVDSFARSSDCFDS